MVKKTLRELELEDKLKGTNHTVTPSDLRSWMHLNFRQNNIQMASLRYFNTIG